MSTQELQGRIKELRELKRMAEELADEIETIEDILKAEMTVMGVEELITGEYKVRYTTVKSSRFDAKFFKAVHADLYEQFTRATETRRFTVA